jgi:hypothetical protein
MPAIEEINLVGKRQDLSDMLVLTNAADMPFISQVKKGSSPNNTLLEYPIDKYATPRTEGVPDGKDADAFEDTQANRAVCRSRVMKQWRNPMVTDLAENVTDQAGDGGSKFAQAKSKALVELKQDMELTACGTQDSNAQTSATVGTVTRGLGSWIATSAQADSATAIPAGFFPSAGQVTTANLSVWEENELRAMLQARYETVKASGDLVAICGPSVKNKVSDFSRFDDDGTTKTQVRRFNGGTSAIATSVDVYRGDYGTVKFFLSTFLPTGRTLYILDMNCLEVRATRQPGFKELPDLGAGPRGIIDCVWALVNRNPTSHCRASLADA